jgi:hypothetical protein
MEFPWDVDCTVIFLGIIGIPIRPEPLISFSTMGWVGESDFFYFGFFIFQYWGLNSGSCTN